MITYEDAINLKHREVLVHEETRKRWYVNGKTQTWKTRPREFRVPLKHGLYVYGSCTPDNAHEFVKEIDL